MRPFTQKEDMQNLKKYCKKWSMKQIVDSIGSAGMEFQVQGDVEKFKETKRILINEIRRRFRIVDELEIPRAPIVEIPGFEGTIESLEKLKIKK